MVSVQHSSNSREKPAPAADEPTPERCAQTSDQVSVEQPSDEAPEVLDTRQRLSRLISANMEIAGDLSMPLVIRRVLESACELVDAHYGALAVR
jgi:hypothetical protein